MEKPADSDNPTRMKEGHHGNPLGALILIGIGLIFLLNNFGIIDWSIWQNLWRLWPVILILLGLQTMLGRSRIGSLIVFLIGVLIVAVVAFFSLTSYSPTTNRWGFTPVSHSKEIRVESGAYSDVTKRVVKINNGIGKLIINDSNQDSFFDLDARSLGEGMEPKLDQSLEDGLLEFNLDTRQRGNFFFGMGHTPEYRLTLGIPELHTDLDVQSGVGQTEIDFDSLLIADFRAEIGTGSLDATFKKVALAQNKAVINVGTGSVKLHLPESTGLQVRYDIGLGRVKVDSTSLKGSGTYTTSGYEEAEQKMNLEINVGTGSAEIER